MKSRPSLVWPANATDPNASTALTVADLIETGGGAALRSYIASRLTAVAGEDAANPKAWSGFAVECLTVSVGDITDGGVEVAASSLQMALAYIDHLETMVARGGA
ncbi:hypothetical protein [Sphingomonas sp. 8AM]|uniref:hypothetical protein n=1 Tax=Sphingomonas sp. 8AM TaxID=2653170 RepID=UPI0012F3126D|nr:hypothetical protein [Sphingomonas sp. 8AM]VXC48859.1 conserved hypothetical protein [Sphingomonas sp. 8AM]